MSLICKSYCTHGGRCVLNPGHDGLHDSRYCTWPDTESLDKAAADKVLSQTENGRDYLNYFDPIAEFIEAAADDE